MGAKGRTPLRPSAPELVSWDVTSRCNLRCVHCYATAGTEPAADDLGTAEAKRFISELADIGVFQLVLLGGEPFLRGDILTLIQYARACQLDVGLSTNGTLITPEVARQLADLGLNGVQVSIDSSRAEVHDQFRGVPGSWRKATYAARLLAGMGCKVIVATVITRLNIDDLPEMARLSAELGASEFRTVRFIPVGRGGAAANLMISPEQARDGARVLSDLQASYDGKLKVRPDESFPFLVSPGAWRMFCTAGVTTCAVRSNGDVTPCSYFDGPDFVAGNIRGHRFESIWRNSPILYAFREAPLLEGRCRECAFIESCRGGCRAAAWNAHHDFTAPDPYCWLVSRSV